MDTAIAEEISTEKKDNIKPVYLMSLILTDYYKFEIIRENLIFMTSLPSEFKVLADIKNFYF